MVAFRMSSFLMQSTADLLRSAGDHTCVRSLLSKSSDHVAQCIALHSDFNLFNLIHMEVSSSGVSHIITEIKQGPISSGKAKASHSRLD